jgi:hypothetical protein
MSRVGEILTSLSVKVMANISQEPLLVVFVQMFSTFTDTDHNLRLHDAYIGLYQLQCFRKVAVHLQKVLEVMTTSVYTGLNPFNFIRKHFL